MYLCRSKLLVMGKIYYSILLISIALTTSFDTSAQNSSKDSTALSSAPISASPQDSIIQDSTEQRNLIQRIVHYFNEAKKDKSTKKFDISFIGGPNYSVDTKLGIGLLASGMYRLDREDLSLPPSTVSMYTNLTTSGFFSVGIVDHTIFPDDAYRINADINFSYNPSKFYGIGYAAGDAGNYSEYNLYTLSLKAEFLKKILNNTYAGLTLNVEDVNGKDFEVEAMAPAEDLKNTAVGGGILLTYDTRDFIPNPYKGIYFKYEQNFYPELFGSSHSFNIIEVTARAYQRIWGNGILAFDVNGVFQNGEVPWTMLSQLGGSRQMRGYFKGRFRDKKQINAQVELRQKIYNRHGIAVWAGGGTVANSLSNLQIDQVLPTYGIGYRWEFKKRVNIRFDYGFGKYTSGFYFNINESF